VLFIFLAVEQIMRSKDKSEDDPLTALAAANFQKVQSLGLM
jgi:hypothetical protein